MFPFSKFCNKSVKILYCFIIEYHNPRMLHSKLCCNLSSGIFLFDILLKKGVVLHMNKLKFLTEGCFLPSFVGSGELFLKE